MQKPPLHRPTYVPMSDEDFAAAESSFGKDPDVIKAQQGIEMRAFWNSPAGKLLEAKAIEQKDDGLVQMMDLDPEDDIKAWRAAKLKVLVSEHFITWVAETLQEGEIAVEALDEQHDKLESYRSTH